MKPAILAIDQGTTSTRAIVFDAGMEVVATSQEELRQIYPASGWVEHDADEIWAATLHTTRAALSEARGKGYAVQALGITNQRETVVVWDRDTGRPIHNAIVWQDRRTAPECKVTTFVPFTDASIETENKQEDAARQQAAGQAAGPEAEEAAIKQEVATLLEASGQLPAGFVVRANEFEKDDDTNHHMDFISAFGNLRARNYGIEEIEKFAAKLDAQVKQNIDGAGTQVLSTYHHWHC